MEIPQKRHEALKAFRSTVTRRQGDLAQLIGVSQPAVSQWEKGKSGPDFPQLLALAQLADDRALTQWGNYFRSLAQLPPKPEAEPAPGRKHRVKAAEGKIAAGANRTVGDTVERDISDLLPMGPKITVLTVTGDSMSPILEEGYKLFVDTSDTDPRRLVKQMVVARDNDGITVKWLRRDGKFFLLVPQNTTPRNPVKVLDPEYTDVAIVGRVVRWIGEPARR